MTKNFLFFINVEEGRIWQWKKNEIPKLPLSIPIQFNTIVCGTHYSFMGLSSKYFQFIHSSHFHLTQYLPFKKGDGHVYSWGNNDDYQLGHGDNKNRDSPTFIESLAMKGRVIQIACGSGHGFALMSKYIFHFHYHYFY